MRTPCELPIRTMDDFMAGSTRAKVLPMSLRQRRGASPQRRPNSRSMSSSFSST
jgi:hypothetical protein